MKFLFNESYRQQFDDIPMCIQKQLVARLVKKGHANDSIKDLVNDDIHEMLDRQLKLYTKRKEKSKLYAAKKRAAPIEVRGEPQQVEQPVIQQPVIQQTVAAAQESEDESEASEDESEEEDKSQIIVPRGIDRYRPAEEDIEDSEDEFYDSEEELLSSMVNIREGLLSFIM